jgi:predicted ribosome quality control (RQC) complex YloA/Tae2 family protein
LIKTVNNTLSRVRRRLENQRQELKQTEQREHLRECGESIKANLHRIKTGDTACDVVNYYSESCEQIRIALDPALTPTQNAQKYFKEYRKANTAVIKLTERIEQGETELKYLESVALELERAVSDGDLNEICNELSSEGYLKRSNTKEKVRRTAAAPIEYCSSDGFKILVGRNNRQNDELTVRMASGRDYWFHTKHIPGAHVIVFAQGEEIPSRTLEEAAKIAAAHSKAPNGVSVEVDYLPAKRVKKPNGAAPGMVVYENYQTAYVTVDQAGVQQLRVSQEGN